MPVAVDLKPIGFALASLARICRFGLQGQCQATSRFGSQAACGARVEEILPAKSAALVARAEVIVADARAHPRSRHAARRWRGAVHFAAAWIAARHKS
jgi:hypothetical protein